MSRQAQWELSIESSARLCSRCLEVFGQGCSITAKVSTDHPKISDIILHRNLPELIKGALEHCWCCLQVSAELRQGSHIPEITDSEFPEGPSDNSPQVWTEMKLYTYREGAAVQYNIFFHSVEIAFKLDNNFFSLHSASEYCNPILADNLESDESFEYISRRVEHCKEHHTSCQSATLWYPKRLITVQKEGDNVRLRLVQTAGETLRGPYITLSHCWGEKVQPLRLTGVNLEEFSENIPLARIPPLHRDAITVAMRMGVQYIWIDCLCIIQDSVEDWRRESATMGSVYKYGLFNIAAASAADSSERLFRPRNPHSLKTDALFMFKPGTQHKVLWYNRAEITNRMRIKESIWRSPLFQRAWVLQEMLLASRVVVFTEDQIHFRCAQELSSESMPTDHRLHKDRTSMVLGDDRILINSMKPPRDGRKSLPQGDGALGWRFTLRRYCATSITKVSDRLVAISAIARYFGNLYQSAYHAGLWEHDFISEMAWFIKPLHRPDVYVAPSWSWASVCGQEPPGIDHFLLATIEAIQIPKILEIRTKASGQDEFGGIDNGWVRICAPLYYMGHKTTEELPSAFTQRFGVAREMMLSARIYPDHHWETDAVPPTIFALPLELGVTTSWFNVTLLLLVAVTPAKNMYKRVGLCGFEVAFSSPLHLDNQSVQLRESEQLGEFLARMERLDEDIHSHERMDNGWHTITII